MLSALLRTYATETLTIANGAAVSGAFNMERYSMGLLHMPAAWTAASIGFQVSSTLAGTYVPLYDKNNTLVQISGSTTSRGYALPAEVAACRYVKLWSQDGAASGTNQGAARTLLLDLKS